MNIVAPTASPRRGTPPRAGRRRDFRADIEGLRAVAVLAVVLFHAGFPGVTGGFVGVDVFFVISGFLITGLLWRDVSTRGSIRLLRFYGGRARRLLPASATVLVATAVVSCVLLPPLQARGVLGDAIACALYVGNYRFAIDGTDYLASDAPPSPLQHYWSLGVEEQFYLLWPALIIGTAWLVLRARRGAHSSAAPYLLVLGIVAAASFLISLASTHSLPSWGFFSLPTRAWELAVGGLVALTASRWRRLSDRSAAIAGWGGLLLIVLTCIELNETTPYPGTAALLPVFGTALVVGAGCAMSDRGVGRALSRPVMRTIGRVSYSWYLWHWPVLLLAPALLGNSLGLAGRLVAVGGVVRTRGVDARPHRKSDPIRGTRQAVCGAQPGARRGRHRGRRGAATVLFGDSAASGRARNSGRGDDGHVARAVQHAGRRGCADDRSSSGRRDGIGCGASRSIEPVPITCRGAGRQANGFPQRVCAVVA